MNIPETLPPGWVWTTIGQVAKVNLRNPAIRDLPPDTIITFVPMAAVDADSGTIADPKEIKLSDVKPGLTLFSEGDVIFAKITPCMENGKSAIARNVKNRFGVGSTEFHVLTPEPNVTAEWIYHFIRQQEFREKAKANFSGTAGQLRVKAEFLFNSPFPLAPLPEQRRIVAAIETHFSRLDAAVAKLKRIQANLKRYRAAVLKAACEGRLVTQDPGDEPADQLLARILAERRRQWQAANLGKKYTEPVAPQTDDLPPLPSGWVWTTLDAISQVRTGVAKGRKFEDQIPISMPYLRVANVQDGFLDLSEVKTIEIRPNEVERYRLLPGDILFNEGGDRDKLGRGAIWNGELQDCIHQNHVFAVRLGTKEIVAKWINLVRQLSYARDYFWKLASQTTNLASINSSNLRGLPIPLAPQSEQTRIVAEVEQRLSVIDAMEKSVTADLQRAARLRQAILKRAFSGRLVAQTPTDEPASRLLERIQTK